ncbi:hypothetical protein FF1_046601 [Malus domestica]
MQQIPEGRRQLGDDSNLTIERRVGCLEKFPSSSSLLSLPQRMRLKIGRWMHTAVMATIVVKVKRPAGVEELKN